MRLYKNFEVFFIFYFKSKRFESSNDFLRTCAKDKIKMRFKIIFHKSIRQNKIFVITGCICYFPHSEFTGTHKVGINKTNKCGSSFRTYVLMFVNQQLTKSVT